MKLSEQINEINKLADDYIPLRNVSTNSNLTNEAKLSKIGAYWPLIRRCLIIAKMFTNEKTDLIIDLAIQAGDTAFN